MTKKTELEQLLENTRSEGDCLIWTAAKNYSERAVWGRGLKLFGTMSPYKCTWFIHRGEMPENDLRNTCNSTLCVNIDHLTDKKPEPKPKSKDTPYWRAQKELNERRREEVKQDNDREQERKEQILRHLGFPDALIGRCFGGIVD